MLNITLLQGKRGITAVSEYYEESRKNEKEVSEYYQENEKNFKVYNTERFGISTNELTVEGTLTRFSANKRIGYDLTYSASKSVSVAKYIANDNRIDEAWDKAVERIAKEVNDRIYTRKKEGETRTYQKAEGLFLAFRHDLSREKDPQLHTHIVVPAKAKRSDGRYTAIAMEKVYKDKTLIDMIGNYELAYQLQQRGIEVHFEKDNLELTGINQTVKDIFSKRSKQIEEKLKELGISKEEINRSFYDYIKRTTRKEKETLEQNELDKFWEQQLRQAGYTREKIIEEYERANREFQENKKTLSRREEKELLKETLTDLHEQYSLIDETTLQKEYLKRIFAKVNEENLELTDYDSFKQRFRENLQELQREGYLHRNALTLGATTIEQQYFYTEEQRQIEAGNVQIAKKLANRKYAVKVDKKEIEQEIEKFQKEKGFTLAEEQSEAVYRILDSNSSVLVVEGDAGAGKTTSMEVVRNIADKKGINVIGLAPTGKAGEELSKTLGRGETIDSFMLKVRTGQVDEKEFQNSLIIVDEAGMVSARKSNDLLKFAERTDSKIVLVGDTKQFQSIEAGAVLRDLRNADIPYHRLSEIRRQKDADYLMITKSLSAKDFETAYSKLLEKDMIRDFDSEEQAIHRLTSSFDKNTLIVTNDNKTKDILNERIRNRLGMKDEITVKSEIPKNVQKKDLINVDKYEKGDIISLRNGKGKAVVIDTDRKKNTVLLEITNKKGEKEIKEYRASELQKQVRNITQQREKGLAKGDRIITLKNSKEFNVKNGELFEVREIDKQNNRIRIANDKKDVWLDLNRYKNIDHAYAITTYKSQGMTVDKVKFYARDKTNYNEFYVAITRGKQSAEIYTTNAVQTLYTAQRTAEKDSILSRADNSRALSRDEIAVKYFEHLKHRGEAEMFRKYLNQVDNIETRKQITQEIQSLEKEKQQKEKRRKQSLDNVKPLKERERKESEQEIKRKEKLKDKEVKQEKRKQFKTISDYYQQAKEMKNQQRQQKERRRQQERVVRERQERERRRGRERGFGLEM